MNNGGNSGNSDGNSGNSYGGHMSMNSGESQDHGKTATVMMGT